MLPFCRLPFRETWVELAHSDRVRFERGSPVKAFEGRPTRVGYLLTFTGAQEFKAHLFLVLRTRARGAFYPPRNTVQHR